MAMLMLVFLVKLVSADISFDPPVEYTVGNNPSQIITVNVNNDDNLDLIAVNLSNSDTISVLLGSGDGAFSDAQIYSFDALLPRYLTSGYFNGGNSLDVAIVGYDYGNDGHITLLMGNGAGGFGAGDVIPFSDEIHGITSGDFDNDGDSDLAVSAYHNGLYIGLNDGNSNFNFTPFHTINAPSVVKTADLNGDTYLDLVVACGYPGEVAILLRSEGGSFQEPCYFPVGNETNRNIYTPCGMVVGDFDNDNTIDIILIGSYPRIGGNGDLSVLLGNGDGTFSDPVNYPVFAYSIATEDFDKDSDLDLVLSTNILGSGHTLSIWKGNNDGTFTPGAAYTIGATYSIITGDFDKNDRPDLALTRGNKVFVLLNSYDPIEESEDILEETIQTINAFGDSNFKNKNLKKSLTNKINAVLELINEQNYRAAIDKLQHDVLHKTNGCINAESPDANDWILDCNAQLQIYELITAAIALLQDV